MKTPSGTAWGKGKYICDNCKKEQILSDDKEILQPCKCGGTLFHCKIKISRSDDGLRIKLSEVITIIEVSIFLYHTFNLKEFLAVIAIQLRILLCDRNSGPLLPKVIKDPCFHPCKSELMNIHGSKMIMEESLFDAKRDKISFNHWLMQKIYSDDENAIELTICDVILSWADKNGGAHIDEKLPEKEFYAIALFGNHLITISEYLIITILERDLDDEIKNKILQSGLCKFK